MSSAYLFILSSFILALLFVAGGMLTSRLLAPSASSPIKNQPYECGEKTIGDSWIQFHVAYYLFALLFLVFDLESAFLYPLAITLREAGVRGLVEIGFFVAILLLALIYVWKKGDLEWF